MAIDIDSYFEVKAIKIFYFFALIFLVVLFLILLYKPITTLFHETDYWWTIPTLSKIAENNSLLETIKTHLFNPYLTSWGEPSMNIYLFLILRNFGFQAKYFIFISIFFHFFCSLLLYLILRKIKLDFRVAFLVF